MVANFTELSAETKEAIVNEMKHIKKVFMDKLAAIEHERWGDWQEHMHSKGVPTYNGLLFSKTDIDHWERQIKTHYDQLSEKEKDSDREQVERYWSLIEDIAREVVNDIMAPISYRITIAAKTREQLGESKWAEKLSEAKGYNDAIRITRKRVEQYLAPNKQEVGQGG